MQNTIDVNFIKFDIFEKRDPHNFSKYLSSEKIKKINTFKSDASFNRSLYAEIIIREFFIKKFKIKNSDIKIKYNRFGKPYIKNSLDIKFSVSHSKGYSIVAFDSDFVGIDIENLKKLSNYKKIANRYFSCLENKYIFEPRDNCIQLERFYEIWTVKESFAKLTGTGLIKNLNNSYIENFENTRHKFIIKDKTACKEYFAKSYKFDKEYIFSICYIKNNFKISLKQLNVNELFFN